MYTNHYDQLFFYQKVLLVKHSYAFIIMPGGFGTMDEYFDAHLCKQKRLMIFRSYYLGKNILNL